MPTVVLKEPYTRALKHLGDPQQVVDEALHQYVFQVAQRRILELQEKISAWEEKYGCSYDLFAYRTSTDETYVRELEANPETREWESDLFSWEFYDAELKEWKQLLRSISTT